MVLATPGPLLTPPPLRQLEKDFPHAYTYTTKCNIWLGAIAYVDDLVLISKSPHELQAMLNTCQSWCEKSRVEINLEKTKIMIFNSRLQQNPNQQSHSWSITAQYLPRDHPQKTTTLKVVDSFKYLGVPIDKDLTMGPLHTLIRDNIQKANGKLQGLLRDLKSSRELHSSHHTTLGRAIESVEDTKLSTNKQHSLSIGHCNYVDHNDSKNRNR